MRQREHGVERVVVVQQHVRMRAVHRRRVRAAALARVLVHVDPAAVERLAHVLLVVGAERRDRIDDPVAAPRRTGTARRARRAESRVVQVVRVDSPSTRAAQPVIAPQRLDAALASSRSGSRRPTSGCCCRAAPRRAWSRSRAPARGTSRAAARRCRAPRRCSGCRRYVWWNARYAAARSVLVAVASRAARGTARRSA